MNVTGTVTVNARFLCKAVTGVERYAAEVSKALVRLGFDGRFLAPRDMGQRDVGQHDLAAHLGARRCGVLTGYAWEQFELPVYSRGGLLVNLANTGPLFGRPQVVVIHDASTFAMPQGFSRAFRLVYQTLLPRLGRVAERVVTVSHFSKAELVRYCNIPEEKISVIYEGREQVLGYEGDSSILTQHALDRPFVLAVGSLDPRKNFANLVRAAERLGDQDFDLVIVGSVNPKIFRGAVGELPANVKHLGYVSDRALKALYEHARCYVYPSLYEGFGLPPIEAMTLGCPVVASVAPPLPEVCGDAVLYCDPHDPADIAAKITRLVYDEPLRQSLRAKGLVQAERYSWETCARELLEVIAQVQQRVPARHARA